MTLWEVRKGCFHQSTTTTLLTFFSCALSWWWSFSVVDAFVVVSLLVSIALRRRSSYHLMCSVIFMHACMYSLFVLYRLFLYAIPDTYVECGAASAPSRSGLVCPYS